MGPLQDPVIWYGINYAGMQVRQWDFQNKQKSGWTVTSSFVLKVPLRFLRPSIIHSVPCDRVLQKAYCRRWEPMGIIIVWSRDPPFAVCGRRGSKSTGAAIVVIQIC